ncbi:hypothetical protein BU15DRAFT_89902 [Melanogaster broomeanus]|nr:hypothetical protein BU15DRAFT_89902 [Melanogaster broomeanus]
MFGTTLVKKESGSASASADSDEQHFERPKGLRGIYYHPITQIIMLGFVCFLCPGMFNALTGLGGGGQIGTATSANSTCATLCYVCILCIFFRTYSPPSTVNNKIGAKWTLFLGTFGYALYVGSYLAINIHSNAGNFVVGAGAVLGVTAAFLWTAQGSIMLSYATEAQKGTFIGIFWAIFNLGAVNFHSTVLGNGTYVGFLVLTLIGVIIPLLMADPNKMLRTDGTKVVTPRHPSWKSEIYNLWVAVISDPMILLLFPMFFASNYFYTWQFNDYNSALFNIRARSLNNLMYWLSQIIGSIMIGVVLDNSRFRRRVRAFAGWSILLVMVFVVHIWAYYYQRTYTRESIPDDAQKMDIYDSAYPVHVWLMIFYGLLDAMWQTTCFWLIGAMSNDSNKLAIYAGFYHSIQSAGAAGVWRMDAEGFPLMVLLPSPPSYMNIFISTWCLVAVGLVLAFPMIYSRVRDTTVLDDEAM